MLASDISKLLFDQLALMCFYIRMDYRRWTILGWRERRYREGQPLRRSAEIYLLTCTWWWWAL